MSIVRQELDIGAEQIVDSATGNIVSYIDPTSTAVVTKRASLARTNTSSTSLFVLPARAIPVDLRIWGGTESNAGTTATVEIGITGTANYFTSTLDVKGQNGKIPTTAVANLYVELSSATQVVGVYAETGSASSAGGPWWVEIDYYVNAT